MTGLVVAPSTILIGAESGLTLDNPVIGWRTGLIPGSVTATTENVDHPVVNLANPATHLYWLATTIADQYITITGYQDNYDYAALARHNLGTLQAQVSVGYISNNSPGSFVTLVGPVILADDGPVMFRFTE